MLDLENVVSQYERRLKILDNIIVFYMEEDVLEINENDEIDDVVEIADDLSNNISKNSEYSEEEIKKTENDFEESIIKNKKIKEDLLPQDIKSIYRKIVKLTHPDKNKNNPNIIMLGNIYKEAVNAKNNNDKAEILYIAYKLNIKEIFEINDEHFGNIRYKIAKLNMDSRNIENSPYWVWYYSDNESLKNIIKKQINNYPKR